MNPTRRLIWETKTDDRMRPSHFMRHGHIPTVPRVLVCDSDAGGQTGAFVMDAAPLGKAERLANGFLRAPAALTRAGVFIYRLADGSTRHELRPPEEVFAGDSLKTLELAPLTLEHPEPLGTPVTADNIKALGIGHIGDSQTRRGDVLHSQVMVTDSAAIDGVDSGDRQEFSLGYWRDLEHKPGTWKGIAYDAIQRNIRYNHAALTRHGRAGPEVRIRLDSETAVLVGDAAPGNPTHTGVDQMKFKITIDGITHEIECADSIGATIQKAIADRDAKIESLTTDAADAGKKADELRGKFDALETEKKKLDDQVTDSAKPERIAELVEKRLDLEREAEPLLNADKADDDKTDISKMTDAEIKKAVVLITDADADFEGKSDDYLQARYDATCTHLATDASREHRQAASDSRRGLRAAIDKKKPTKISAADKARDRMITDTQSAWKKDLDGFEDPKGD